MVSIIKNQLLKHLSRFTKNLSSDKINFSTFKGEGDLSNLELDEIVLTDLLELPSWLRLNSAWCNKVSFRIQWTKLKSVPIFLLLDEVRVEVETCEELRSFSVHQGLSNLGPAKYSFINKVIDGITVAVNMVQITFKSPAFVASVQISRILVESRPPTWQRATDLRMTRLKDPERGQLLVFKELEWQTVRIEAKSTHDSSLSPLRLLTNQARCRITIKKRLSDSFVLGSRLCLILDDLLWVLTDSQLKAALHFLDSLAGLVQKATELTRKKKAARKLELLPEYQAQIFQQARTTTVEEKSQLTKIFTRYDVVETSYHFLCQRIDLHLCDDAGLGRSCHPDLKDGAVLQVCLQNFQVDYYPYHLALGDRKHWPAYREAATSHSLWLQQSLSSFRNVFLDLIDQGRTQHVPLSRQQHVSPSQSEVYQENEPYQPSPQETAQKRSPSHSAPPANTVKSYVLAQLAKLMTSCMIVRIKNFSIYQVSTSKRKHTPKELITGDKQRFAMPEDLNMLHAEFTYYYYPGDITFPLPPSKLYAQINPIVIYVDVYSFLWMNSFALGLLQSLTSGDRTTNQSFDSIDVKVEAIMPHIVVESSGEHKNQKDRPKTLHVHISRASITNVRTVEHSSRADLAKCVDTYQMGSLFYGASFPSKEGDYHIVTEKFMRHVSGEDAVRPLPNLAVSTIEELISLLDRSLLWTEAKDVWCISLEPLWCDFLGASAVGADRPVSLVDAFPLTLWAHLNLSPNDGRDADIHVLAHVSTLVSVQLNHYQYLFLLRLMEDLAELTTYLSIDSNKILNKEEGGSLVIGILAPQVEVTLVTPSQTPGKEYIGGGDIDSMAPDSVSLPEELSSIGLPDVKLLSNTNPKSRPVLEDQMSSCSVDLITGTSTASKTATANGPTAPLPFTNVVIPNNLNVGISSMKKGLSSLMTSIDSALKSGSDDDTLSMRSDISSDSEKYVMVTMATEERTVDAMFRVGEPQVALEVASEVVEGTPVSSPSDRSLESAGKRKDLVSISTFKMNKVELFQQSRGFKSAIAVQVSGVQVEECGSIPWDEFQSKFGCRARAWNDAQTDTDLDVRIKARLDHLVTPGEITDRHCYKKWCSDNAQAQVNDLSLEINMSTVIGLSDLFEDEVILPPLPVEVHLENISIRLNEDRPPSNITSPGPVPVDLVISQLKINRGLDGVLHIEPPARGGHNKNSELEKELEILEQRTLRLGNENAELKRRLAALGQVSKENHFLRREAEETQVLRSCLATSQDEVAILLEEKRALLDQMTHLKEQIEQLQRSKR